MRHESLTFLRSAPPRAKKAQMSLRKLENGDEPLLELFLAEHAETSMFLRSNLRASGLAYRDRAYHGEYFASLRPDGAIEAVLAHYWNGNILMQAGPGAEMAALCAAFRGASRRPVAGMLGPGELVEQTLAGLGLAGHPMSLDRLEGLYALDLADLSMPPSMGGGMVDAGAIDTGLMIDWRRAYEMETGLAQPGEDYEAQLTDRVAGMQRGETCWALMIGGEPVSLCGFNARLPDIVQLGPVWTPPEHRSRGHARALVAACLEKARDDGVAKAILFTDSPAASKAYEAVGFRPIGQYRLAFMQKPAALGKQPPA